MNKRPSFQLEIPRRSHKCAECQTTFEPGTEYTSSILEGQDDESWQRLDFCVVCWDRGEKSRALKGVRTYWKSRVPQRKKILDSQEQNDRAFELLRDALSSGDDEAQAEAFVLSLFLVRKKVLLFRQELEKDQGTLFNIYESADTEEMICVPKISLSSFQIEKVQMELARKLKG